MTNRLKAFFEEPDPPRPDEDYYEIRSDYCTYYVTRQVAEHVARQLARRWPPRWLRFRDLSGAEVWLRSRLVEAIAECTTAQRAAEREFRRARRLEEKADRRPWDDDDW